MKFIVTILLFFGFINIYCAENLTPQILQNSPYHSPFAYILGHIKKNPNRSEFYFNEGYLNFKEDFVIDNNGTKKWNYEVPNGLNSNSPDISFMLFNEIDKIKNGGKNTHIIAYHVDEPAVFNQFASIKKSNIHISDKLYKTHGKNMQASNGKVWFSQNGSLNLQTVGESCKANNSIVFVETKPELYNHFKGLWSSIYKNSAVKFFKDGTKDSTGLAATKDIAIGERNVSFYGGRNNSFVGASWQDGGMSITFPNNLFPPIYGELPEDLASVNWYDQIIFDAGMLLLSKQNIEVNIDIVMFEIGRSNPFVDNLYRFINNGFENNRSISKARNTKKPSSQFVGKLNVNLLYQFQSPMQEESFTAKLLKSGDIKNGTYTLHTAKVWQNFALLGQSEPKTPQDMHHKFAIITYTGNGIKHDYKLYVSTSNLDEPRVGSGKKWQTGTVITPSSSDDALFRFYEAQVKNITFSQQAAAINNTKNGNSYFDKGLEPDKNISSSGIAAFVFPLQLDLNIF